MTDLDHQLDHELRRLPAPVAPVSLLPRVMQAVAEAEAKPWYSRAWVTWPRAVQVASAVLLLAVTAGLWRIVPIALATIPDFWSPAMAAGANRAAPALQLFNEVATLSRVLWDVVLQPIAAYFFVLGVGFALACALLWTAVNRIALGGAHSS